MMLQIIISFKFFILLKEKLLNSKDQLNWIV